ncbi:hypothetical protein vBPFY1MI_41 [Pseudomonas phage vB_PF_Y1-MI]|nr:hypothetical protein vBPFY1MI_41 [Pseudomonas phage vB_PF_Y1-MI]
MMVYRCSKCEKRLAAVGSLCYSCSKGVDMFGEDE